MARIVQRVVSTRRSNSARVATTGGTVRPMKKAAWLALLMFIVGSAFVLQGCGDQPLAPQSQNDNGGIAALKSSGDAAHASGLISSVLNLVKSVVEVIGRLGGQICVSLGDGRKCGLTVPAGALNEPTAISMRVEDSGGRQSSAIVDFGPDGLVFERPTTLFYDVNDPDGAVKTLTWFNPSTNRWVVMGTARVQNGRVTFSVNHFSKYGIS